MTEQIKTQETFSTVSDWRRLTYACIAMAAALLMAIIYRLTESTLVPAFETYVSNLLADPTPRLHHVGAVFLMLSAFFQMLIAAKMATVLARKGTLFDLEEGHKIGLGLQGMTLVVFAVAGFMEGILASQYMFDKPLSIRGIFATAVLGAVALPSVAFLFTTAVRSLWQRPHSAVTNMLLYGLFGILTILTPTLTVMFAVLSLGLVAMSVILLPLGYRFRCAYDGVTGDWRHHYRRYDPIG